MSTPSTPTAASISMHSASVPIFVRLLGNLSAWLDKAEAHAVARKFEPTVLLNMRLAPDMLPFTRQVQIACDTAKFCVSRLAQAQAPRFEDDEASIGDLKERIAKTIDYVKSVPAAAFEGSEGRDIAVPMRNMPPRHFMGEAYLHTFAMPNFFFHCTTTYGLLRQAGVELGKRDFLGLGQPG